MTPELRANLRTRIMGHEGLMLKVYDDATGRVVNPGQAVKGWLTIGYGRNLVGRGITLPEADMLLQGDMMAVEGELNSRLPQWRQWAPARQIAVAELGYNLGVSNLQTAWPNTWEALKRADFQTVAGKLYASKWRKQVGDGRALSIIRMIQSGDFA